MVKCQVRDRRIIMDRRTSRMTRRTAKWSS